MSTQAVPTAVYYRNPNQYQNNNNNNQNNMRNAPQTNCMVSGTFVLVSGGMNLAMGLGWNQLYVPQTSQFQFCWFVGVIVGAILAAPLISFMPKRVNMVISGVLVLVGGIMFVSAPYNYNVIVAARYIDGFATGFTTIPFIVNAGEIAAPSYRGYVVSMEQFAISVGITAQILYMSQWNRGITFSAYELHGILSIICGVVAVVTIIAMVESPIFYLRKGNESAALESLRRLYRPQIVTDETRALLELEKSYLQESEHQSWLKGVLPLFKMILYRSVGPLTFTWPLNLAFTYSGAISVGFGTTWPPIVYCLLRSIGAGIAIGMLDKIGRKAVSLFSILVMASFIIGIGGIFSIDSNAYDTSQMTAVCWLSIIMQFFTGLFVPSTSTYLGEAFPLHSKPYFIAIAVIVEQAIQIIIICTFVFMPSTVFYYGTVAGVVLIIMLLFFIATMPETRGTTLNESHDRFNRTLYMKFR